MNTDRCSEIIGYEQPEMQTLRVEAMNVLCASWTDGSLLDVEENWNDLGTL